MFKYDKVYNAATIDTKFMLEIKSIDTISTPAMPFDEIDKSIFAGYYLGWLIGTYDTDIAMEIYKGILK